MGHQNSIKLSFLFEMLNFEIISVLMAFVLFFFFTLEIGSLFCSGVINPFESSKLWHHPSQHTMAFEAFRPSSQLAKLGVLYELCRGTFGTKGTFCGVSEVLEEGA